MATQNTGMKYDGGKLLSSLLYVGLAFELEEITAVLTYGAQKYAADSWQSVPDGRRRYMDATYRHLTAMAKGELWDEESGLRHVAHAITNLLFISWLDRQELVKDSGEDAVTFQAWLTTFNEPPTK